MDIAPYSDPSASSSSSSIRPCQEMFRSALIRKSNSTGEIQTPPAPEPAKAAPENSFSGDPQVEALSSEKGTLLFRIEAAAKQVEENKMLLNVDETSSRDLESDSWEVEGKKLRPLLEKKINLGKKHIGSWLHQLDALYVAGAIFLRRNSTAKSCSVVYLFCLHFWVLYILFSHFQPTSESKSGAVISLENINSS